MRNWFRIILAVLCFTTILASAVIASADGNTEAPAEETTQETAAEDATETLQDEIATDETNPAGSGEDESDGGESAEKPTWLQDLVSKFGKTPARAWITIATLIAVGIILLVIGRTGKQWTTKAIAYAALSVALSFVLSCIRLFRMPNSGSVTPASMLPIMLFSAAFGIGPGLLTGMAYGILQCIQGGGIAAAGGFAQFALDYLLAFTALGLAGLAKQFPEKWGLYPAIVAAVLARLLCHTLAGVLFWNTELWASFVYNITYLGPELVICVVLAVAIAKPVMRIMKSK